jgi:DDE superfamily endonuclease
VPALALSRVVEPGPGGRPHDRAHQFFSRARWNPDEVGLAVAKLVTALLVPAGQPVTVAIDDTLFRRRGKEVWAASWFHDGSAPGPANTGYGNNWVIAAVVVRLPMVNRPVAVPALAKLVIKDTTSASRLWLARRMAEAIAGALPGRPIHVVADAAYAGKELRKLPPGITWTTRLRISRRPQAIRRVARITHMRAADPPGSMTWQPRPPLSISS